MKTCVFTIGRMNPPTRGHEKVLRAATDLARTTGADVRFYVTRTHDSRTNPLTVEEKLEFLRAFFPNSDFRSSVNAFTACKEMAQEGYERVVMVVGQDRDGELIKGLRAYANHPDPTKSLGLKDVDTYVVERSADDYSATKARQLAAEGNLEGFSEMVPSASPEIVKKLYDTVRQGLGVKDGV